MSFYIDSLIKIAISILLGGLIGLEREQEDKSAGLRTCILVTLSMTTFMIFNLLLSTRFNFSSDFSRIPAYCIASVGFIGSGVIVLNKQKLEGITTASIMLCLVGLGLLIGIGEYILPSIIGVLVFGILKLKYLEFKFIFKNKKPRKRGKK